MSEKSLIIGIHSVHQALINPNRKCIKLVCAEQGINDLLQVSGLTRREIQDKVELEVVKAHELQELGKAEFENLKFNYQRIPSSLFMVTEKLPEFGINELYTMLENKPNLRVIALDQVTDVHNAGAIMRTAAFYNVDAVLVAVKGSFGDSPSFLRIASGAIEHVPLIKIPSLPRALSKLIEKNFSVIGLSEHSENAINIIDLNPDDATCLVLGAEDVGLSNAVSRVVDKVFSLKSQGQINSLNVSVAAAVAMEQVFSN